MKKPDRVSYIPPEASEYETPEIAFAILEYLAQAGVKDIVVECYIGREDAPSARITTHFKNGNEHNSYPYVIPELPEMVIKALPRKFI